MARRRLIRLRRGTAAEWTSANPTLEAGEPGVETDTGQGKIGDGSTAWNSLDYIGTGGGGASGPAGGVLSGTYPNPGFAADMATQAELDAHTGDTTDAHDASAISFSPAGSIAATDVQAAIVEVAAEAGSGTIDWGEVGDIVAEAFGSTASAGVLDEAARADHRHAMPSNADVQTAYEAVVAIVSQAAAEAGSSTTAERWTPQRVAQAIAALGFAPNVAVQTKTDTSGTYTPTTGMVKVLVICQGGGGGAPGATGADEAVSGGGAGGTAIKLFSAATIGASQPYAVGQTSTGAGNTSGLGTANALLQATGGAVGVASGNLTVAAVKGGQGGIGTLGDLNIRGGSGTHAAILSTAISHGGNGGNSVFGGGGRGGSTATTVEQGEAGGAYGGGAGGGKTSDGTDLTAVAGAAGVIYFIEFLATAGGAATSQPGRTELVYRYTVTGSDKASIDTGVDTAQAGSLDWTNGDVLEVFVLAKTDDAAAFATLNVTVNNDTGANYDRQYHQGNNATTFVGQSLAQTAWQIGAHGQAATTQYPKAYTFEFPGYADTAFYKVATVTTAQPDATAGNNAVEKWALGYRSTSALTRLKIAAAGGQNLKVGTKLLIYKRKSV